MEKSSVFNCIQPSGISIIVFDFSVDTTVLHPENIKTIDNMIETIKQP